MNDESPEKYRQWVATNFDGDIKEQLFDIYKEAMHEPQNDAARISKTMAKTATLMARLSRDQERTARRLVFLTWTLVGLTFVLLIFTMYLYTDTHSLAEREKSAQKQEMHEVKKP